MVGLAVELVDTRVHQGRGQGQQDRRRRVGGAGPEQQRLASMPVYQTRNGQVIDPETWMTNPDDQVYSCWQEFAKQLFWDFQMGEAFIMPMAYGSDGLPQRFRVLPPHLVNVELGRGGRVYSIGSNDLTGEILHIRYKSTISMREGTARWKARSRAGERSSCCSAMWATLAKTGGVPLYWMEIDRRITPSEGQDLLTTWAENRMRNIGQPALVGHGAKLNQARTMNAKEMGCWNCRSSTSRASRCCWGYRRS
jgi:hypothetical protein